MCIFENQRIIFDRQVDLIELRVNHKPNQYIRSNLGISWRSNNDFWKQKYGENI